jgi:hypothetical protein
MKERIRIPENTQSKIEKILNLTDPYNAVVEYIDLIENHFKTEKGIPSKYDSETGEPKEWSWSPYEQFEQTSFPSSDFLSNGEMYAAVKEDENQRGGLNCVRLEIFNPSMLKNLKEIAKNGPVIIKVNEREYIIKEEKMKYSTSPDTEEIKEGFVILPISARLDSKGLTSLL